MRQELDLVALRATVQIKGSRKELEGWIPYAKHVGRMFKSHIERDLVEEESAFGIIINNFPDHPHAFKLAYYLDSLRGLILESRGIEAMFSEDVRARTGGAILIDMSMGFRSTVGTLMLAHDTTYGATNALDLMGIEAKQIAVGLGLDAKDAGRTSERVVEGVARDWNRWRALLQEDSSGRKLISAAVEDVKKSKDWAGVKVLEVAGAELAEESYNEYYDMVEKKSKDVIKKVNARKWNLKI